MKKYLARAVVFLAIGSLATYAFTGYAPWMPIPPSPSAEGFLRSVLLVLTYVFCIVCGFFFLADEDQK